MALERTLAIVFGICIVLTTLMSAVQAFVLPRAHISISTKLIWRYLWQVFLRVILRIESYAVRDRLAALFAPVMLIFQIVMWISIILVGYSFIFWGAGSMSWSSAFDAAGSSLMTLGFATLENTAHKVIAFTAGFLGMLIIALLIGYLPTIYSAFSRRETRVTLLKTRAGAPPSPLDFLARVQRVGGLGSNGMSSFWQDWEQWFAEVDESHTSLTALIFFRSPQADSTWVTAAATILDSASLTLSVVDVPFDPRAAMCIRAGYLCMWHVAEFFEIDPAAHATDPEAISITRAKFEEAYQALAASNVPLKPDIDQAWRDFAGWRANYDVPLNALLDRTMANGCFWQQSNPLEVRPW